jgi:hypothetical protein
MRHSHLLNRDTDHLQRMGLSIAHFTSVPSAGQLGEAGQEAVLGAIDEARSESGTNTTPGKTATADTTSTSTAGTGPDPLTLPINCKPDENSTQCDERLAHAEGCYSSESLHDCRQRKHDEWQSAKTRAETAASQDRELAKNLITTGLNAIQGIYNQLSDQQVAELQAQSAEIQARLAVAEAEAESVLRNNSGNWVSDTSAVDARMQAMAAQVLAMQQALHDQGAPIPPPVHVSTGGRGSVSGDVSLSVKASAWMPWALGGGAALVLTAVAVVVVVKVARGRGAQEPYPVR